MKAIIVACAMLLVILIGCSSVANKREYNFFLEN